MKWPLIQKSCKWLTIYLKTIGIKQKIMKLGIIYKKDYDGLKDAIALLMDSGMLVIVHLGCFGYDETSEVFIPNKEILDEFRTSTKTDESNSNV